MARRLEAMALGLAAGLAAVAAASAADLPLKALPPAAVVSSDGWYVWLDGSYQSINLPRYGLGTHILNSVGGTDAGVATTFDPRATGAGVNGAIGHVFHDGTFSPALGSNVRIEIGASYVRANDSQASASGPAATALQMIDGVVASFCGGSLCQTRSTLDTDFASWRGNVKARSDFRWGAVTLTPALVLFAGQSRINQTYHEDQSTSVVPFGTRFYDALTTLRSTDWGTRIGLKGAIDIVPRVTLAVGGDVGVAARSASLAGNDALTINGFVTGTAAAAGASTSALLANAEASLAWHPVPAAELRTFVGLNYDNHVAGILLPSFAGRANQFAVPPFIPASGNPATIGFFPETSFYAGGGVVIRF